MSERYGASRRCRRKRPAASAMPLTGHHFQQEWQRVLNWYDSSAVHRTKPPTGTGGEQTCSAEIQTGTVAIQVRTAGIQPRSFAVQARVTAIPACEPTIRVRRATVRVCSATVRSPASCGRGWSVSRNPGASSKATPAPATPPGHPAHPALAHHAPFVAAVVSTMTGVP